MKLFLPQKTLEGWMLEEKADLEGGRLVVREGKTAHSATPGLHFTKLVSGEDTKSLVGRVKTEQQVAALGGDASEDTVILGDDAYEVVRGFITEVESPPPVRPEAAKRPGSPEADLLAAFILDKL